MLSGPTTGANAQSVQDRTPNLTGGWTGRSGGAYFNFLHRFDHSGAPQRKVSSSPTFLLAFAPLASSLVGVQYATNSTVADAYPNEWEVFARAKVPSPLNERVSLGAQVGYNAAARSGDVGVDMTAALGPFALLGAGRFFSDAYGSGKARGGLAAGAVLPIGPVAISGDVGKVLGEPSLRSAWGIGLQMAIPGSPHTLSLHASNTTTGTLQGSSVGMPRTTYGFEFTIPLTPGRYLGRNGKQAARGAGDRVGADGVAAVEIQDMRFGAGGRVEIQAGDVVRWRNSDPVQHTATADDGSWDSGTLESGEVYERRFDTPGEFPYHCGPHPFMEGVVVVRPRAPGR